MRISATNFPAVLCTLYNNMYTYDIRVQYNGQSGDINNANSGGGGGGTSRSNLAEDVVKVYIVLRGAYTRTRRFPRG